MGKAPASHSGMYGRRWRKLRQQHLYQEPLCRYCKQEGRTTAADEVDHIQKHDGDYGLFYDPSNLQSLCKSHHRGAKAREERSGKVVGCDPKGNPIGRDW